MELAAPGNEIKVAIRVRPLLPKEQVAGIKSRWQCTEKMISPDSSQSSNVSYVFDRVFDENATNRRVYEELASDIVKQAMIGFNGTLFTYGQSGSGKTYTIDALRTFAIRSAYDYIENCPAREFLMRVSYIELYNEKLTDLLSDASTTLTIREDYEKNVYIDGLQEIIVKSQDHVKDVLTQGNARRTFAETRLNDRSSRAHCIFRLVIESRERDDPEHSSVYVSYLNLVDLAGSERAGENSGERLREGVSINLSLLTLSQVIRKLSGEQREFINYRDSKLTRILQNALEGNSKTAILCTVAPFSVEETHSTLRFALNAKKVKTKPQQNEVLTDSAMLKKSQLEITKLKNKIKELEERNLVQDDDELARRREEREHLIKEFSSFLCVSSKAREEKRGFDKKRRETVCVPQMYRSVDFKAPRIPVNIPKLEFPNAQPKQMESFSISESPPANDSVFSVSHSLDSPCNAQECSYCDLSFTGFEQAIVQDSVLQKYKAKLKKYEAQIADLNRKLKHRSGMFVTCRRDIKGKKSSGSEFLNPTFCEEDEAMSEQENWRSENGKLDEDVENIFEDNETLKSQNALYKNEIEGLRTQLEVLTVKFTQYDEKRDEYEKTIVDLSDRIKIDEKEIKKFKSREEEIARQYEEDMKRWKEKVEKIEWERNMQEVMKEEKGLLETISIDKHDTSGRDLHEDLEMQKKELLSEWEEMGRLKEELNKQAINIENTLCVIEKDKERLQKEKDRIDREWNDLEKANDDLRKEKEEFDQKQENAGSERLQEAMKTPLGRDVDRRTQMDHVVLENHPSVTNETDDVLSEGQASSLVEGKYPENIMLNEEKEALLQELDSLRQSVCELNARKSALELEIANCIDFKCEDGIECLPEKTDVSGTEKLQKEWEILRDAQKQLKDREIEVSELEAVSERIQDRCCMLEELNERLEEEVEKLRMFHSNKETVEDTDTRQGSSLQEEWKKLTKYQAELSQQEENVERKIERLCMLEEEKEQFEEEKNGFYRERECLREAEMDLRKAREAFKQEQLKVYQELETDKESDMVKGNQILEEDERLQEQLEHLRKVQEQFYQDKEAFEQKKSEDLARDQEALNREWCILKQAQNELRIEKEALEMRKVNVERSDLSGRDVGNVGRFTDNLSQLEDESGIVTATSWDNSSLCSEFKDGPENMSVCIHEKVEPTLQEKKEEGQEQSENIKEDVNGKMLSESGDVRAVKSLEACEDSHSFEGKLARKRTYYTEQAEDVEKEELALQCEEEEERYTQYTLGELQTLHDEVDKLQLEKEQLFNEKVIFQTEKEQLQEVIDALQRENKMLKEEKEDPQLDKKSHLDACSEELMVNDNEIETFIPNERNKELQNEWENLTANENNFGRERILLPEGAESLKKANQRLQKEIENLKQCLLQNQVLQTDPKQNLQDVRENTGTQDIEQIIKTEYHVADITVDNLSLNVQNESAGLLSTDLEAADLNEQDPLDETVRIPPGLSQSGWDVSRYTEIVCNGEDNAEVCDLMTELKTAGFFTYEKKDMFVEEKDTFDKEKDTFNQEKDTLNQEKDTFNQEKDTFNEEKDTLNEEKDTFNEKKDRFNQEKDTFNQEKDTFNKERDTFNQERDTFNQEKDTFDEMKDTFNQDKDTFDEKKDSLHEEWEKLKRAQEQLYSKEAVLRDLEKDIAQRSDILYKFEAEQRILHQSTDHLKQAEDILSRQQEELKVLEDNFKSELVRLLALQKEKEIIQIEIEKLIEGKIVLEKEKEKLQEKQEICQEKNTDFQLDRTCKNDMEMTEEDENNKFQEDQRRLQIEKSALEEAITSLQQQQAKCQEDTEIFLEDKVRLQEEKDRLLEEKDRLYETITGLQEHKARCQEEMEIFRENNGKLQEEKARFREEKDILRKEKDRLQELQEIGHAKNTDFRSIRKTWENDKELIEMGENNLHTDGDLMKETKMANENDPEIYHLKNSIDQGKDTLCVAQKEHLQKEEEELELKKAALQIEEERIEKEKEMLEAMKTSLYEEAEKLKTDKEMINEKTAVFQQEQARLQREQEIIEMKKIDFYEEHERLQKDIDEKQAMHQKEKETWQYERETLEEQKAILHEEQVILQREKESFKERNLDFEEKQERLEKEKEIIEQNIELVHDQEEKLNKEKRMLEKEIATFQREQDEFQIKVQIFEQNNIALQEMQDALHTEKEMFENENMAIQDEKERFQEEKKLFEERYGLFQEDQRRLQVEKSTLDEEIASLQEQQARCQKEMEMFWEEKARLQEEKVRLQEEKDRLHKTIAGLEQQQARYQKETEILQAEKDRLQEETDRLREEKDRIQEAEDNFHKKWDNFQMANTDITKYREQLNEKERLIENKMKDLAIFEKEKERFQSEWDKHEKEKERFQSEWDKLEKEKETFQSEREKLEKEKETFQSEREKLEKEKETFQNEWNKLEKEKERFQNEWDKLEKAHEDLKHERASLKEIMVQHEEEKRRLQEEWDTVQQCREDLKQSSILFQEKKTNFEEELQTASENLRQAQDKVVKQEEEVSKKYAEIEEKMQAVLEQERTINDKEPQCVDQTATDSQLSPEELMEQLQNVEDDLEDAYEKIHQLENLITRGKAVLAEKTEAAREVNDRVKELEEAIDAFKSNLASLNSNLEAKSNECEKLKKSLDNYRTAAREQEVLKKEMEAMVRGRTKDRECYEDTIRQLNLKLRDKQNAETSFFVQRETPSEYAPSLDQMRKIVEFENAAKFLELNQLKHGVQEQKAKIADLENEKSQLQAEIKKLQLLLDNESVKSEAMKSTANQAIHARRKLEEELVQLRKQLGKGAKQSMEETPDEVTKMLRNQLQEKDQLIDQLSKSLDSRNMRWNAVALRHKNLIEENHSLQKLVAEHQKHSSDSATNQAQCNVVKDDDRMHKEKQTHIADLVKENSELKASVEKLKLEFHQQTVSTENHLKQQQNQSRSAENLSELSTQTESSHLTQQSEPFSVPTYRSGGAVESFVIAVKDREIRDFKKKLEKQSAKIRDLEKEKSQLQAELRKLQHLLDNGAVKSEAVRSTTNQTMMAKQKVEDELVQQSKEPGYGAKQSTEEAPVEATNMLRNQRQEKERLFDQLMKSVGSSSVRSSTETPRSNSFVEETHNQQKLVAESQNESTGFTKLHTRWNAIKDNERMQKEKQTQIADLSEENSESKEALKSVEPNTNPNSQKSLGSEVKQQLEEHRHRRFQVNSTDKENIPFGM